MHLICLFSLGQDESPTAFFHFFLNLVYLLCAFPKSLTKRIKHQTTKQQTPFDDFKQNIIFIVKEKSYQFDNFSSPFFLSLFIYIIPPL